MRPNIDRAGVDALQSGLQLLSLNCIEVELQMRRGALSPVAPTVTATPTKAGAPWRCLQATSFVHEVWAQASEDGSWLTLTVWAQASEDGSWLTLTVWAQASEDGSWLTLTVSPMTCRTLGSSAANAAICVTSTPSSVSTVLLHEVSSVSRVLCVRACTHREREKCAGSETRRPSLEFCTCTHTTLLPATAPDLLDAPPSATKGPTIDPPLNDLSQDVALELE
eukprot:364677-Chlamydomonas_euryale.AAC.3